MGRDHLDRLVRAADSVKGLVDTLVPGYTAMGATAPCRQTMVSSGKLVADAVDTMGMVAERAGIHLWLVHLWRISAR